MYKRRARVVLFSVSAPCVAMLAHALAQRFGAEWVEPCAAYTGMPPQCPPQTLDTLPLAAVPVALDGPLLQWADLLVCLDQAAREACPASPGRARPIFWADVAALADRDLADPALHTVLQQRIEGMVGGMRLLAGL